MSDLTTIEKVKLEKFLKMGGGYVLDFSDRTFKEFIVDNTNIDIYNEKYNYASGSKANRLRCFWRIEPNQLVGTIISCLLDYWKTKKAIDNEEILRPDQDLFDECKKISERLNIEGTVENIDVIKPYSDEKDFSVLAKTIRESIEKNEPESALDRLHTYVTKYIRGLCDKHKITYEKETPLHSLLGGYIKYLSQNNLIKSEMTDRILKSPISILDSFNKVRNDQSFAHDNQILNYSESILIFNNIANSIRFIESIENTDNKIEVNKADDWLPPF
jgi:hypothetical protein